MYDYNLLQTFVLSCVLDENSVTVIVFKAGKYKKVLINDIVGFALAVLHE